MHTSLEHLNPRKQRELQRITKAILYYARPTEVEFIILFGSHARGDWVEDEETGYDSDYDILVITKNNRKNLAFESKLDDALQRELGTSFPNSINIIAHGLHYVNQRVRKQYYFFVDVITKEGIALYDSGRYELADPEPLLPEERQQKAQDEFDWWLSSANAFISSFDSALKEKNAANATLLKAAFDLHQATERFYHCFMLVFTDYKSKSHDIKKLGKRAGLIKPEMWRVFPQETEEEKRLFELLRRAYVDARYKMKTYAVTAEELEQMATWVRALRDLTETRCKAEIQRLGQPRTPDRV